MRKVPAASGATLLEILMAMIVIGLVATGMITAFIFGRQVIWRSGTELSGAGLVTEVAEELRGAVGADLINGLSLKPGIYVDQNMQNPPAGATRIAGLNFPPDFARFQTDPGNPGATVAAVNHGDGRMVIVEDADHPNAVPPTTATDSDGDGQKGVSFDGLKTHLRRVRIRVKWTSPTS